MKVIDRNKDGRRERRVVTSMIVDNFSLGAIASKWTKEGLFASKWANLIGGWCVQHYLKHKKAPGRAIEVYFEKWANVKTRDQALVGTVESYLTGISNEYSRLRKYAQGQYDVDLASESFNSIKARELGRAIDNYLENGDTDKALEAIAGFNRIDIGSGTGIDVLQDYEAMKNAFLHKSQPLITFPGAAGRFFDDTLERDGFVSLEGPEKRGKTWWLIHLAWRAMFQGRRVAFFEVGDLSETQTLMRFGVRAARRPLREGQYNYPISMEPVGDADRSSATHEIRNAEKPLTWKGAVRALKKLNDKFGGENRLRVSIHPARSISVLGIRSVLDSWERFDWVPDVVVIDYADILAPITGTVETRDQINATWIGLRALSQQLHGLVITATQTDTDSYDTDLIGMDNFTEDKRKRAHVTASVGLNQDEAEMNQGIYRLNWVVRREHKFDRRKCLHAAGCLDLANPMILSTF